MAELEAAWIHGSEHRDEILRSEVCGCFRCRRIFPPEAIESWTDDEETALCPHCGVDSVLGSASGFPITPDFLGRMKRHWFGRTRF
ncbi:MAG: hypothetical protein MH204_02155 [Fimbriimonadaceae bacterium]|nr:hypothetical protein [Fimbriimonadaceae bacterium]